MSKLLIVFLSMSISLPAFSQTILKVENNKVTVNGSSFKEGQSVNFLDSDLNVKAMGLVEKVSAKGNTAIVKVMTGNALSNYTVELAEQQQVEEKPIQVTTKESSGLSREDREILARGEIGTGSYLVGAILGTYPLGFGIGQAIQGRYAAKGWIFTVGELGSVALIMGGFNCGYHDSVDTYSSYTYYSCSPTSLAYTGVFALIGFKIWEIVDLWSGPPAHNRRYQQLNANRSSASFKPLFVPTNDGFVLGLQYKF